MVDRGLLGVLLKWASYPQGRPWSIGCSIKVGELSTG